MSQSIDAILKLYSIAHPSLFTTIRSGIINWLDACAPLKKLIVKTAIN